MNVKCKYLIIFTIFIVILVGCSNKTLKPDSSDNTSWLMKLAIDNNDYESFDALFSEGRKGSISESEFNELQDITTAGTDYKRYELLTFENGQMLLVRLAPSDNNTEIKIENVMLVPDEMKAMFKDLDPAITGKP
ncbi:hypothetical protein [Fredinandcohnia quinoae]|uniref:Uncharacterized protein n=1 Tax=Fredinandcohnia quinoae TaxID=2918902 RepID=A0AAW5E6X5_9BACI|nr:hypothetical protein [Fredinandcohnia sp. SECRCQ15]MCH1624534.1 hypothetical protein [Fredinandcohnia sp. SECRCQ15]